MKFLLTPFSRRFAPLAAALLLAPLAGQAQATFSFGPRLGVNISTAELGGEETPDTNYRTGVLAGLVADIGFGHFAVQPSLLFSQRGFKTEQSETFSDQGVTVNYSEKIDFNFNYLEIPVQAVYRQREDGTGFQLMVGPYIGVGLNGEARANAKFTATGGGQTITESESENTDLVFDGDADANDDKGHLQRLDVGLNAGIGYRFGPLLAQAGYSLGLTNLIPNNEDRGDSSIQNRAFQVSLSYLFNSNK